MGVGLSKRARRRNKRLHAIQGKVADLQKQLRAEKVGRSLDVSSLRQRVNEAYREGQAEFCRQFVDRHAFVEQVVREASYHLASKFGKKLGERVHNFWNEYDPVADDRLRRRQQMLDLAAMQVNLDAYPKDPFGFIPEETVTVLRARLDMPIMEFAIAF